MSFKNKIPIVFCTDINQAQLCSTAINSIVINSTSYLDIYILIDSDFTKNKVLANVHVENHVDIKFILVEEKELLEYYCTTVTEECDYLNSSMNIARFLIPKFIKSSWALYLDTDIVVNTDINNLLKLVDYNNIIYGLPTLALSQYINKDLLDQLRIEHNYIGFNTGVVLYNLDYWRTQKLDMYIKTLINLHRKEPQFKFLTQPILNLIYYKKYTPIDSKWNFKDLGWSKEINIDSIRQSYILHFNGQIKPNDTKNKYHKFWKRWHLVNKFNYKRINENNIKCKTYTDLLVTTYFCSKKNPQAGILSIARDPNSIVPDYNENDDKLTYLLFNSVKKHNQTLVVFHDGLDNDYIKRNSTHNILFIEVKLGPYSTNDERFFVYNEFINQVEFERIFFIDCFDVEIRKQPFGIFDIYGDRIYVGRDCANSIRNTPYVFEKLQKILPVTFDLDHQDDLQNFSNMPLYNAGIIGGVKKSVNILINFICNILEAASSKENVNMAVVNYALYKLYLRDYKYIAPKDPDVDPLNDLRSCNGEIFSGYPLNSSFKKFEDRDDVYFIHK